VVFSSRGEVLEIISIEGLGVVEELDLIGLVVLGIVPRVVSLVVWLDVRGRVSNLVDLWDGGLIPLVAAHSRVKVLLPWLVIPSKGGSYLDVDLIFERCFSHTKSLDERFFWERVVVSKGLSN